MLLADLLVVLTNFVQWLVVASLKTIPLIICVLLLQRVLRKFLSASANYLLWFTVLISLCIPFGWKVQFAPDATTGNSTKLIIAEYLSNDTKLGLSGSKQETIAPQKSLPVQIISTTTLVTDTKNNKQPENLNSIIFENGLVIFSIIWLTGAFTFLLLILTRAYQFNQIKNNASQIYGETATLLQICKLEMGVNKPIQLLSTHQIQSPVTLGWIKPVILLPENLDHRFTAEKLKHVLLHEISHVKRHDIFFNWMACLVNVLHWFNPAVWLACRSMRKDMEMACDALVINHLDKTQRKSYGATLIEISEIPRVSPRVQTTLGMFENHNELKQRLNMIKEFTVMSIKNTVIFGIVLVTTALTALAQPELQKPQSVNTAIPKAEATKSSVTSGISLRDVAARAEKDLKIKILVGQKYSDNSVQVNFGSDKIDYGQLLTQLKINYYTAYKTKDYIQIIPIDEARFLAIPTVEKDKSYYEDEVVTDYLTTEKSCAAQVLATVRPLVPQYAHLSSDNRHTLIIIDTFGNIQRIRSAIKTLEANLDAPVDCEKIVPPPFRPNTNEKNVK